ncbi:MAG: hypothetical protein NTW86_06230 [Candidatus Sumerlaeota bacterium]|nr:hypothetical protein [Candidatus Sumerlaeota bacterium]
MGVPKHALGSAITLSAEATLQGMKERDEAIQNMRVEYLRSIYMPARPGPRSSTQVMIVDGKVVKKETIQNPEGQPEYRSDTRHILTAVGPDMVRLDSYEPSSDAAAQGPYKLFAVTLDWGDERRSVPAIANNPICIWKGVPNRRGEEAIGNESACLTGLDYLLSQEANRLLNLSDVLEVHTATLDDAAVVDVSTNPRAKTDPPLPGLELKVDPEKSFVVREAHYWRPSRENLERETITRYDDLVMDKSGIWYPTTIVRESYRRNETGAADTLDLIKREQTTLLSFEINLPDLDTKALFDRALPPDRAVIDYRVSSDGFHYNTSDPLRDMMLFQAAKEANNELARASSGESPAPQSPQMRGPQEGPPASQHSERPLGAALRFQRPWPLLVALAVIVLVVLAAWRTKTGRKFHKTS